MRSIPVKYFISRAKNQLAPSLTFAVPYWVDDVVLDAEDHCSHDHCCKNGLMEEVKFKKWRMRVNLKTLGMKT